MRRLRLVRPCPEVPPELRAAVEAHGAGHCDLCGKDVFDLTGPDGPAIAERLGGKLCGRVATVVMVVATAASAAACSSVDVNPAPSAPATTAAPPPNVDAGTLPDDTMYYGMIEYDEPVTPPPTVAPGREKPR